MNIEKIKSYYATLPYGIKGRFAMLASTNLGHNPTYWMSCFKGLREFRVLPIYDHFFQVALTDQSWMYPANNWQERFSAMPPVTSIPSVPSVAGLPLMPPSEAQS